MKKAIKKCRNCEYFLYQIHHRCFCHHEPPMREGVNELHDGRAIACEEWEEKAKKNRVA